MKILINVITTISDYKIKMKNDKTLIEAFSRTHEIFNKNHMTFNDFSNKIEVDQNLIFSSVNVIIAEKTIFVINLIFQITQLKTVNSLLISIEHL